MVESTFQLARGFGPERERQLWRAGIACWSDLLSPTGTGTGTGTRTGTGTSAATSLSARAARTLHAAIDEASEALARRDADRLATLLPARERWRLFAEFADDAAYLDIETGDDVVGYEGISAIGVLDRRGPRLMLAGRDLHRFPEVARGWPLLVTFNGLSFDVPILRRAFPTWEPPVGHIDLRHVLQRLGQGGGLKAIERRLSALRLARPDHLAGIGGWDACSLFRRGREGDRGALRRFAEYNLYDVVNLRSLMAHAYNELIEAESVEAPALRGATKTVAVPGRGDVLYDVSKILMGL